MVKSGWQLRVSRKGRKFGVLKVRSAWSKRTNLTFADYSYYSGLRSLSAVEGSLIYISIMLFLIANFTISTVLFRFSLCMM